MVDTRVLVAVLEVITIVALLVLFALLLVATFQTVKSYLTSVQNSSKLTV